MITKNICLAGILTLWFSLVSLSNAEMSVSPFGVSVFIEEGDEIVRELDIINNGDNDVEFKIRTRLDDEDEENRQGPQRDDLGDVIAEYNVGQQSQWSGMAWDGELMWSIRPNPDGMIAVNREGEVVEEVELDFGPVYGMCWDGEAFWIGNYHDEELTRIDSEGNILESIGINGLPPFGITWDGENLWYGGYQGDPGEVIQQISLDGEILRTLNTEVLEGDRITELCWVPGHMGGQLWIVCCDDGLLYQLNVDEDDVEIVQQLDINRDLVLCIEHDGENIWHSNQVEGAIWYVIDDGAFESGLVIVEPKEGIVAADEFETFELTINPDGLEEGLYNILLEFEFPEPVDRNDDPIEPDINISVIVSFDSPAASLFVSVIDQETEEPIEGVSVTPDRYLMEYFTDEDGRCEFEALPTGDYEITFTAMDYLPLTEQYRIDGEGELRLDVEMLYAEFTTELDEISIEMGIDEIREIDFEVTNTGNGALSFTNELCLLGDANAEPFDIRNQIPVGELLNESRVQGAIFTDELFYLACANNRDPQIVILNREGDIVNRYDQFGDGGRYGYKDLAFDGELIWGAENRTLFVFTPEGELRSEMRSPFNPTTNIAFDNDRELLWISSTTTNIVGIDREGRQIAELDRDGLRIYGLAYWADDPDGFPLYAFHKDNNLGRQLISKFNPENGERILIRNLEPENGGEAAAAFITNQYDIYSWVFMSVINNGADDRIDIWQLDARTDWMEIEPAVGIIDPDEISEFALTLDATGLPPEVFEAEIVFSHNGRGRETHIPITMTILADNAPEERQLQLHRGWNMVSVNVEPENNDIIDLTQELVDNDLLRLMKDGAGRFYVPEHNFNNIPGWNVAEGYQINMIEAGELLINGIEVEFERPIQLIEGWQIVSYYPRIEVDPWVALSGIIDVLILAKDEQGRFLNTEFNFCNLPDLAEGNGYQMKLSEETELVWCVEGDEENVVARYEETKEPQRLLHLGCKNATGENMSLLVLSEAVQDGEIGVYTKDKLIGSGVMQSGKCGIAVWGDDQTTDMIDGAISGEIFEIDLHVDYDTPTRGARIYYPHYEIIKGDGKYHPNDFQAIRLLDSNNAPTEFGIVSAYPNPFNSSTTITYNLTESGYITLHLFDLNGRQVMDNYSGNVSAGSHTLTIDGSSLSSGVYIAELKMGDKESKKKLTLIQ